MLIFIVLRSRPRRSSHMAENMELHLSSGGAAPSAAAGGGGGGIIQTVNKTPVVNNNQARTTTSNILNESFNSVLTQDTNQR